MKNIIFFLILFLICSFSSAQHPSSKSLYSCWGGREVNIRLLLTEVTGEIKLTLTVEQIRRHSSVTIDEYRIQTVTETEEGVFENYHTKFVLSPLDSVDSVKFTESCRLDQIAEKDLFLGVLEKGHGSPRRFICAEGDTIKATIINDEDCFNLGFGHKIIPKKL